MLRNLTYVCYSGFLSLISSRSILLHVNLYLWENCADERNSSEEISHKYGIPDTWREMYFTHVFTCELFDDNFGNYLRGNGNVGDPVSETCYQFERSYQVWQIVNDCSMHRLCICVSGDSAHLCYWYDYKLMFCW